MSDLCFIPISCEQEDYDAFEQKARSFDMDTAEWVLKAAKTQLIKEKEKEVAPVAPIEQIANAAFTAIDGKVVEQKVVQPPVVKLVPKTAILPNNASRHPCYYLAPGSYPTGFSAKDCFGTCTQPSQEGKPCYFSAAIADNCGVFRRKPV